MTSKQALDRLYSGAQRSVYFQEEYDILSKDLEVLEILKHMLEVKKGGTWEYLDIKHCFFDTQEQIDKVKEWLKNE